jgi:uncharacterized Zn finger protein
MDTGEGRFKMGESIWKLEEQARSILKAGGIFTVGEEVELKGSLFRIKKIGLKEMRLTLLKRSKSL